MNDPDFHIDARNACKETAAWGFVDVFRKLHPDLVQYTYWDFVRNAFERNFGWRIDHILTAGVLAARCHTAEVDLAPVKFPEPPTILSSGPNSKRIVPLRKTLCPAASLIKV